MNSQSKPKERRERRKERRKEPKERRRLPRLLSAAPAAALTAAVVCLAAAACSGGNSDLASVEVNTSPEDTREEGAQAASPQSPQSASPPSSSSADASSGGGASQVRTTSSNPDPVPERPRTPPPASVTQLPSPSSGGGRAAAPQKIYLPVSVEWEALRQCESRGSYTFVDPTGTYYGAYQFTTRTWDRLAAGFDDDLVGVLPSAASAADQDKMAARLWIESRSSRWPACAHVFGREAAEEYLASLQRSAQTPSEAAPATTSTTAATAANAPSSGDNAPSSGASEDPSPTSTTTTASSDAGSSSPASPPSDGGNDGNGTGSAGDGTGSSGGDGTGSAGTGSGAADGGTGSAGSAAPAPDPSTLPAVIPNVAGFPTPEQWAELRHCESRNNYQIVSSNGLYYGAYQFWPDTWNSVARKYYPRLLDVLPSHATPQDQDRMAYKLWETRGAQPWPVCGRHLN